MPPGISSIEDIVEISETYEERVELLSVFMEQKVSHTLFLIDDALSSWEAAGKKPANLRRRMVVLRQFREAFGEWEKQLILSKSGGIEKRKDALEVFVRLSAQFDKKLGAVGG